jgi:hypothetical protein
MELSCGYVTEKEGWRLRLRARRWYKLIFKDCLVSINAILAEIFEELYLIWASIDFALACSA